MNRRWFKLTLRIIAAVLLVIAAIRFVRTVSFHTEEQTTPNGVTIDHVLGFAHVAIILPLIALLLLALSFIAPNKRSDGHQ